MELEILGWILGVSSVLIISTNVLVAAALVLLIRKKGGQSWCLVLNLALADTLVGVAIIGISVIAINSETSPIHRTKCLMFMALVTSPSAASILTMFLVSLDRYIAIKLPLHYSRISRTRTTAVALVTLWALSFAVGFLPGMVAEMQVDEYGGTCTFFSVIQPKSIILVFCICFFPVLLIFIYFYLDILKIACGHQRRIRIARLAGSQVPLPNRFGRHVKALRTVALLVGCFTLSWCPFFIVSVVQVLCQACTLYSVIETYLWLLGLSNSLINPLVYAFWQREVRQELSAIFASLKGRLSRVAPLTTFRGRHSEDTVLPGTTVLGNSHIQAISRGVGVAHPSTALAIVTTSF